MLRHSKLLIRLASFLVACIAGCDCQRSATPSKSNEAISEFNDRLARQGRIVFLSWNGRWIGNDSDTDLTFLPGGFVEMTEYGFAVEKHKGTYRLDADGAISLQLDGFERDWPAIVLEKDAKSLLLRPKDDEQGLVIGNRGGATVHAEDGPYWPFRLVERKPFEGPATGPSK